jgi:formylglycine-generating enzyme required for sulfatase activity
LVLALAGCPTGGDDAGGGEDEAQTYDATVYTVAIDPSITGGAVTASPASGTQGTEITLTVSPEGANKLVPGSLKYTNAAAVEKLINTSTKKFSLPASDVTVSAAFTEQYVVNIDPALEGIVSASPAFGASGALITLSVTDQTKHIKPETFGYDDGSGLVLLKGATSFNLGNSDVTVQGAAEPWADLIRRMVRVDGGTVTTSTGVFSSPFNTVPVTVESYSISAVELTYELWYTVVSWAKEHGYTFFTIHTNAPPPDDVNRYQTPLLGTGVRGFSWIDLLVWCNAYSEWAKATLGGQYADFEPLYKTSSEAPVPNMILRDYHSATDWILIVGAMATSPSHPDFNNIVQPAHDARGFRLLTDAEWEFSARGGDPSAAAWSYAYAGSNTVGDVAWYNGNSGNTRHTVGEKLPNTLGLYDMSGNLQEFVWEAKTATPTNRVYASGKYDDGDTFCKVTYRSSRTTYSYSDSVTLRIAGPASIGIGVSP